MGVSLKWVRAKALYSLYEYVVIIIISISISISISIILCQFGDLFVNFLCVCMTSDVRTLGDAVGLTTARFFNSCIIQLADYLHKANCVWTIC